MIYVYKNNLDKLVYLPKGYKVDLEKNHRLNTSHCIELISSFFDIDKKDIKIKQKDSLTKNAVNCILLDINNKTFVFDSVNQCIINAMYVNFNYIH